MTTLEKDLAWGSRLKIFRSVVVAGFAAVLVMGLASMGVVLSAQAAGAATGMTYYVNSAVDTGASGATCATVSNTGCGIDDAIASFNADSTIGDADTVV